MIPQNRNDRKMTRGLRNRNPGNIRRSKTRYLGEVTPSCDVAFKQFETMAWGYRAMFVLLDSYRRRGYVTLRQMIARYAPPVENHTKTTSAASPRGPASMRTNRSTRTTGRPCSPLWRR